MDKKMELLTAEEVAQYLKTSVWWVYRNQRALKALKLNKLVRFDKAEIDKYLEKMKGGEKVGSHTASGKVSRRDLPEPQESLPERRIRNRTGSQKSRKGNPGQSRGDKYGLYEALRKSPGRVGT
jgi:excisionase family DNA binding protein